MSSADELKKKIAENVFGIASSKLVPHEIRCIKRDEGEDWIVDTTTCFDRDWKYETAVCKDGFNRGRWIVVEGTDTEEEAVKKHDIWCAVISTDIKVIHDIYEDIDYHA